MPHVITDACATSKDRSCVKKCPVDCIHPHPKADGQDVFEMAEQLYIDPTSCIDCGACVPACPVHAIFFDDDLPEDKLHFIQINADYFVY